MRTRCKICGITRLEDALTASALGVDALGFVFYKPSPRYVLPETAAEIIRELPPFVTTVGLFVNHSEEEVRSILGKVDLNVLQFHGEETDAFCRSFGRPFYKALGVVEEVDLVLLSEVYSHASALLLDAHDPVLKGGTGKTFDWSLVTEKRVKPLILAGGLDSSNVRSAIQQVKPYAVDVSGGVEASKGIKDANLMKAFLSEVYREHAS